MRLGMRICDIPIDRLMTITMGRGVSPSGAYLDMYLGVWD